MASNIKITKNESYRVNFRGEVDGIQEEEMSDMREGVVFGARAGE